jgi:HemK-related putative methylase
MKLMPRHTTAKPLWKRAARRFLKGIIDWRFRHFRPDAQPAHDAVVQGIRVHVAVGVFDPALHFTSNFLARYLLTPGVVPDGGLVLDMGCGTGLLAICAGRAGAGRVIATDINPAAVQCAANNVRRHGLQAVVEVRQGDLFRPVAGLRFDLVVCNPPYFRGKPHSMGERAYMAGPSYEWLARFAGQLPEHLAPGGRALLVLGDSTDIEAILKVIRPAPLCVNLVARRDLIFEALYIYSLTPTR